MVYDNNDIHHFCLFILNAMHALCSAEAWNINLICFTVMFHSNVSQYNELKTFYIFLSNKIVRDNQNQNQKHVT